MADITQAQAKSADLELFAVYALPETLYGQGLRHFARLGPQDSVYFVTQIENLDAARQGFFVHPTTHAICPVEEGGRIWVSPSAITHVLALPPAPEPAPAEQWTADQETIRREITIRY
jgi:hypothetical protein